MKFEDMQLVLDNKFAGSFGRMMGGHPHFLESCSKSYSFVS